MSTPETERLRVAIELQETGMAMQRQKLRREHPGADDAELERLFREWLVDRPPDHSSS